MKVEKQLRWLIFLIVPFIIILSLHVVVPVSFILNSNPIFEDNYLNQQFLGEQLTVRSTTMGVRLATSIFFNNIVNSQRTFMNLFGTSQKKTISVNVSNIKVNNAFEFSQKIDAQSLPLNTTQNIGMWFSTGKMSETSLTDDENIMLERFKQNQLFFDSLFVGQKGNYVHSSSLYVSNFSNTSEQIYFQYPSSYSSKYNSLDAPTLDNYYSQSLNTYTQNNQAFIIVPFVEFNNVINQTILVMCIPKKTVSYSVVGCLKLKMELLSNYFQQKYFQGLLVQLDKTLTLSNDIQGSTSVNPQIVFSFNNDNSTTQIVSPDAYFDINQLGLPASTFYTQANDENSRIHVQQKDFSTYYVVPILTFNQMITMHLVTAHTFQGVYNINRIISQKLKQLLIPIIILIIIAAIVSYYVMKRLLGSIDKELFELESRIKFIVDGDIHIEIPHHEGTQDIKLLYDEVKIINKLHRYSTQSYFRGYFTEKILMYNEALQFLKSLNYDTGNILQNMGESAMYAEEWETGRQALKQSVQIQLKKMEVQFGTLDQMMPYKKTKKIPSKYKEMEVILIRKLFKLNFVYLRYLELKQIFTRKDSAETLLDQINFKKKHEQLTKQSAYYMNIQKKAFYPNYSGYCECIILLLSECKQLAGLKKLNQVNQLLDKVGLILQKYTQQYPKNVKMLKQKGSKHRLLRMIGRLTGHSTAPPAILKSFKNVFKAKIVNAESKNPEKYIQILNLLTQGSKAHVITASVTYMTMVDIWNTIKSLNIDVNLFESTQICRQSLPWKALHYGPITPQDEEGFLKYPTKFSTGLERQFVMIFDCSRQICLEKSQKLKEYQMDKCVHIFQRLVKKTDRMSIIRHGTKVGTQVHCGLIFKESNETVLKLNIKESIQNRNTKRQQLGLIESFCRAINRTNNLKSEKVIIMFFRSVEQYKQQFKKMKRKRRSKGSKKGDDESEVLQYYEPIIFGSIVEEILQSQTSRNVKLILFCANGEDRQTFRQFFGLNQINRRIWNKYGGINKWNNTVYVIEEKHKSDLDRILMYKGPQYAQNHIFFL